MRMGMVLALIPTNLNEPKLTNLPTQLTILSCPNYTAAAPAGAYSCGRCTRQLASRAVTAPCGATLIVCPGPILQQWREEIQRHIQPGAFQTSQA